MNDENLQKLLYLIKKFNLISNDCLIEEDNFTFIPAIELIRDKNGEWIST